MQEQPIPLSGRDATKLRERLAQGLTIVIDLLDRGDHPDLAERLGAYTNPALLMTQAPEAVLATFRLAWELRDQPRLDQLFKPEEGAPDTVRRPDQPIAPCGASFEDVLIFALRTTAQLYFERAENEWARTEAERDRERRRRDDNTGGGLMKRFGKKETPIFDPSEYRLRAPMRDLFPAIEPYLTRPEQFYLLRDYATWSPGKVRTMAGLIDEISDLPLVAFIGAIDETDLEFLRICCRVCVDALRNPSGRETGYRLAAEDITPEAMAEEDALFLDLLLNHRPFTADLITMGRNAESALRIFAPLFGSDIWSAMADREGAANVVNVPESIQPVLGPLCRYVPPRLSRVWAQMNDMEIIRDLLVLCREEFGDDDLIRYMIDESRQSVWSHLPRLFNNQFDYQRDAKLPGTGAVRNYDDLRVAARGVFDSLRQGRVM